MAASAEPARALALARQLLVVAGPAAALTAVNAVDAPARSDRRLRTFEALLLGLAGKPDAQLAAYRALASESRDDPLPWIGLGNAASAVGRLDEAVAALRRAIACRPGCGAAYWGLANLKSFEFTDADVAAMRKALRRDPREIDRLHLEFALGKAFEQRRDFGRSFAHYAAGNRLRAARLEPAQMEITGLVDSAIATFDQALFDRHAGSGCKARGPVFIVGLHRSGSTLVEQILASHPMIEGAGELPAMQLITERLMRAAARSGRGIFEHVAAMNASELAAIGSEYLERCAPLRSSQRPLFVDKLPANWLYVGLIRLALPNARIVDARRHPMACGFSNFKQLYAVGVTYSYSLRSIGRFYRDYLRTMAHFAARQPGAIHHVVNERLIDDPEGQVRRLLDHIGVPFDPACLEFHRHRRAVRTPSAQQVRRPLNRDGVDAWRAFEPWLGPLREALGPALHEWLPD